MLFYPTRLIYCARNYEKINSLKGNIGFQRAKTKKKIFFGQILENHIALII